MPFLYAGECCGWRQNATSLHFRLVTLFAISGPEDEDKGHAFADSVPLLSAFVPVCL